MHRLGPEPQGLEASLEQDLVADCVASGPFGLEMVRSIDFDNQSTVEAHKIKNVV
mgnify:CR=1 FL=1